MRFRTRTLMIAIAGIALALCPPAWLWREAHRGWTAAALDRRIRVEVPEHCSQAEAASWFDRQGIRHQWLEPTHYDFDGTMTIANRAGLSDSSLIGMERGHIDGDEANLGILQGGEILVYFFFDKQGQCVGRYVRPRMY